MKPLPGPSVFFAATALFLAGCDPEAHDGRHQPKRTDPGGFSSPTPRRESRPVETVDGGTGEDPTAPREKHDRPPQVPDNLTSKPPTAPPPAGAPEYAKAVPGKPGFVTSPYKPFDGLVDVRGFAPGTELQDPYEKGRTFLVPAQ